jgi:thiosulfate/3-mercaptopyruvate sulfurtransferase
MSSVDGSPLVSTTWLAAHLGDPRVRIIDVRRESRYENGRGISFDDHDGYRAGHIPGAVFAGMIAELSDRAYRTSHRRLHNSRNARPGSKAVR